jgi:hypothetical protein
VKDAHESMRNDPKIKEAREHMRAARKAFHSSVHAWLPEGFVEQRREARREFLKGMRSFLDYAIEKTEKT